MIEEIESGQDVERGWPRSRRDIELGQLYAKLRWIDDLIGLSEMTNKYRIEVTKDLETSGEIYVFADSINITPTGDLVLFTNKVISYAISSGYWVRFRLISVNGEDFNGQFPQN